MNGETLAGSFGGGCPGLLLRGFSCVSLAVLVALSAMAGCGGEGERSHEGGGYTLASSAGAYSTGSGSLGLALLVTLRDDHGHGPSEPWDLRLVETAGEEEVVRLAYDDPSPGSYVGWWFSDLVPQAGEHRVEARSAGLELVR